MKLLFVSPRYGEQILGGAETLCRNFAERLVTRGHAITVFTTCAVDHASMANALPAGVETINGVVVRRFPVDRYSVPMPDGQYVETVENEFEGLMRDPHPTALYRALAGQRDAFDLILPIPYPFGMSMYASALAYDKTLLWACLHDETRAYMSEVQVMLRSVRGVLFNTDTEQHFMRTRLGVHHPNGYVVGVGIDPGHGDAAQFRAATGIHDPFLLYAGRLEAGKNVPEMLDFFTHYKAAHPGPLKLVLMGSGPAGSRHPDVRMIGFQPEQSKQDAYAACLALVQPSLHESFSIVMMEAWRARRPVLVHRECDVTRAHVKISGGGFAYLGRNGFADMVNALLHDTALCERMGAAGAAFVDARYAWPAVLDKFEAAVHACLNSPGKFLPAHA